MSENLIKLWTTQFSTVLELKLQQMGSKLRAKVRSGTHVGKQASPVNQISAIAAKAPAGRFAPKNRTDADFTRRWVFPVDREIDQLIDSFDELRTIVDPKSQYVENASNAIGRSYDDNIITNVFGTSEIGQDAGGLSAETWSSFGGIYDVAVDFDASSAQGLTVAKLIEAKRIFRHNHVDLEVDPITLVIGSKQESDLLRQTQVVSTEFNDRPILTDGRVTRFMGFDIVVSERLQYANNVRSVIAMARSGMYLGIWQDMTNRVSIRNDLSSEPYDLYTRATFGSTRIEPGRVVKVLVEDTTGGDITP